MEEGGGRGWQRDDGQQDAVASIQGEECRTGMRLVLILDVEGIHKARILELVLPLEKRRDVEESNAVGIESEDRPCFNVCEKERKNADLMVRFHSCLSSPSFFSFSLRSFNKEDHKHGE